MRRTAGLLLAVMLTGGVLSAHAAPNDLAGRQSDAERQQAALRDRIENLQKEIDGRESARKEAADALKQSESAIFKINRRRCAPLRRKSLHAGPDLIFDIRVQGDTTRPANGRGFRHGAFEQRL